MIKKIPRIMISAFGSDSGKTMITCSLLKLFQNRNEKLSAYKCGPDYIDTMFHREVLKTKSTNLDLFLTDENTVKELICENSNESTLSIIEGVMGYYDGLAGKTTIASSYNLACVTDTPVVLVVNCKGSSMSIVPQIDGFIKFRADSNIKAVILNNISAMSYPMYKELIEENCGIKVAGYMPRMENCSFKSRHLGLITAMEITDLECKLNELARMAEKTIDYSLLMDIANSAQAIDYKEAIVPKLNPVKIAVANDNAFCFYYSDALNLLQKMGAELIYFSPLNDSTLPDNISGIILGGGYPELYAEQLEHNQTMRESIKSALMKKTPCIAECGGFMYLLDELKTKDNNTHKMVGFISGTSEMTEKLNRFGYVTLTATKDTLLLNKGEEITAHEFHYSNSTNNGDSLNAIKPITNKTWDCIHANEFLFAGYSHSNLCGKIEYASRFLKAAIKYQGQ